MHSANLGKVIERQLDGLSAAICRQYCVNKSLATITTEASAPPACFTANYRIGTLRTHCGT